MSRVRRRQILIAAGAMLGASFAPLAQQATKIPRIGHLSPFSRSASVRWHDAFRQGLRDLGWVDGKNISIEHRYADGRSDRIADFAAEFVNLKVDLIFVDTTSPAIAVQKLTRVIPIVIAAGGDTVASGLADSLARPGGNVTGLDQMTPALGGKRLELIKAIVPKLSRVAVLWNSGNPTSTLNWKEIQIPARKLEVQLQSLEVRGSSDFDKAFENATRARAGALAIMPDPMMLTSIKRIADLAAVSRLPSIYHLGEFVDAGGLAAYGPDRSDLFRRAAIYVDKILKGAKPSDLPIEQPTKFELVINLKTAKALGLTIPQSVLLRADRVIE